MYVYIYRVYIESMYMSGYKSKRVNIVEKRSIGYNISSLPSSVGRARGS